MVEYGGTLTVIASRGSAEEPALVRCPSCLGLRTISHRNRDTAALCLDCRRGEVVSRETFRDWWLERFSADECAAMARAIWRDARTV